MQMPSYYPVASHTDNVGIGSTFVAIKGYNCNGLTYVPLALERGATTIVIDEQEVMPAEYIQLCAHYKASVIRVVDTRLALAQLSAEAAGYPAQKLRIIGITGTKGKTTTAFVLEHVLRAAGYTTALLGTVKNSIGDHNLGVGLTTQQPDYLHQFFKLCVEHGVDYVIMEVAAQGLSLHRTHGIEFDGILFTNFSQEHAEFYSSLDEYFAAKCLIFNHAKSNAPVLINSDDRWCKKISACNSQYKTFALGDDGVDYAVHTLNDAVTGLSYALHHQGAVQQITCPTLLGTFNVYNTLGVYALAHQLGINDAVIIQALATFTKVPGRLEQHALPNGARCIIDYAHNPSSYESVLSTLRSLTHHLIVVFGCGGDRDKTKRPVMGACARKYADMVILTSDNPRSEDPAAICADILAGIDDRTNVITILDRAQAIEYAVSQSHDGSLIALLGKGPDEYQIVGDVKTYFSEAKIIDSFGAR